MRFNFSFPKSAFFVAIACILQACGNAPGSKNSPDSAANSSAPQKQGTTLPGQQADDTTGNYEDYYVVIADTGTDYYQLDRKMYVLSRSARLRIDTMNRHCDPAKNEIVVSDNDENDKLRGEYFPRRYDGVFLSLEHLNAYTDYTARRVTGLMAAMCRSRETADSVLEVIRPYARDAYVYRQKVYQGCMD